MSESSISIAELSLDKGLLEIAKKAIAGQGDGRISTENAADLFSSVRFNGKYDALERETVDYILKNFQWTEAGELWFRAHIEGWTTKPVSMSVIDAAKKGFSKHDVLPNPQDRATRAHDLKSATVETYQDHDEIALIVWLEIGMRVEIVSDFIELEGELVELKGGHTIPVRAIEKVRI